VRACQCQQYLTVDAAIYSPRVSLQYMEEDITLEVDIIVSRNDM